MRIRGLQTLTLLDFPGHLSCTVFLGGCNFRCPFCQNGDLVLHPEEVSEIPEDDLFALLKKRKGILEGVCITGGEPTLDPGLEDFIKRIKDEGYMVKLDTNGYCPDVVERIITKGLVDMVAMDIKNSPERYAETAGVKMLDVSRIIRSADILMNADCDHEFRTTVVRELHDRESFIQIGEWLAGNNRYYLQSYRDSDAVLCQGFSAYPFEDMERFRELLSEKIDHVEIRGADGG